jgi:branched-chain amino acid transport system permease protein
MERRDRIWRFDYFLTFQAAGNTAPVIYDSTFSIMEYLIHIAILICIYGILGLSLNLIVGYTGLLSVTQAAFYGIGAYVTAILLTSTGMNFFLALLMGIIITGILSLAIGFVLSKFKDDYYALGSFGFNVIIYSIFLNWQSLTRGPLGIPGIPRPNLFGFTFSENLWFLVLSAVFGVVIYFLCQYITNSSFGRVLKAIREDDEAIRVFGYHTLWYKLTIFVIGAMMASVAGALFATYITFIDPSTFTLSESIFILAIIILGGLANNKGAVLGAACLILLPEILRFVGFPSDIAAQMRQVTYGVILILLMLYRPQGLVGEYRL